MHLRMLLKAFFIIHDGSTGYRGIWQHLQMHPSDAGEQQKDHLMKTWLTYILLQNIRKKVIIFCIKKINFEENDYGIKIIFWGNSTLPHSVNVAERFSLKYVF